MSFNRYRGSIDLAEWAKFHELGKPALIGEFNFGLVDRGLFWEGLVGVGRESERGPSYAQYLRAVADNPDFVGAHWFQYLDQPLSGRTRDGEDAISVSSRSRMPPTRSWWTRHVQLTWQYCTICSSQ